MKAKDLFFPLVTLVVLLFTACNSDAQNTPQTSATAAAADGKVEVIQFHSEHRCITCLKIEELTKETLQNYPSVPFTLVNVDDKKNEKLAEKFEAFGTALFIYNAGSGKKVELTEMAFMNAHNKQQFMEELTKELDLFINK